jgi:predicted dehydrogenase
MTIPRRDFVKTVAAATAATALSSTRVLGANERIRLGLIGCGSRGVGDMNNFIKLDAVDVVALNDVYAPMMERAKKTAPAAKSFKDYRQVLEMKDLDAVLIAVPDHWHAPITIDALNAGKDVYVEKPLTLKIEEGPAIVKAARINKRVCQVGMQQRSGRHYLQAKKEYFDTGKLGKITLVRTWWHGNTYHLRTAPASLKTQPADLDWAKFVGPIAWRDYDPQQFYNWRAYLDFGGG